MDGDDLVIRQHAPAAVLDPSGHRPHGLPDVDVRVGNAEHPRDRRVQQRLLAQRLRRFDLLAVDTGVAASRREHVRVRGVVERGRHEEPTDVLDRVRRDLLQDAVLRDALLGRARILDRVAAARMQQAVEPPARPLGQIGAVDEHDVEPAQRGIPGHAGAGGASADHQYVGAEHGHGVSLTS